MIGLIVRSDQAFFAEIAKRCRRRFVDKGIDVVAIVEEDPALEAREKSSYAGAGAGALVIASSGKDTQLFRRMASQSQPLCDRPDLR